MICSVYMHVSGRHVNKTNSTVSECFSACENEKKYSVTYIVMEGLCLTGVLACLPSVWSRTVQIPEYTEIQEGGRGGERSKVTIQSNTSTCVTAIHNPFTHSHYLPGALKQPLMYLSITVRGTQYQCHLLNQPLTHSDTHTHALSIPNVNEH